jgi:hypothetical protein
MAQTQEFKASLYNTPRPHLKKKQKQIQNLKELLLM